MKDNSIEFLDEIFGLELSINEIVHAYDPTKAHEYYMRVRKLKGREKGLSSDSTFKSTGKSTLAEKRVASKKRREEIKAQVARFQARLERLETILEDLVEEAKARSGATKDTSKTSKLPKTSSSNSNSDSKPKTAAEKREAAEKAKEKREKEDPTISQQAKELKTKIIKAREEIKNMRTELADAKKRTGSKLTKKTDLKRPLTLTKERR